MFPDADIQNIAECLREMLAVGSECLNLQGIKGSTGIVSEISRVTLDVASLVDNYAKLAGQILKSEVPTDVTRSAQNCQERINGMIVKLNARIAIVSPAGDKEIKTSLDKRQEEKTTRKPSDDEKTIETMMAEEKEPVLSQDEDDPAEHHKKKGRHRYHPRRRGRRLM